MTDDKHLAVCDLVLVKESQPAACIEQLKMITRSAGFNLIQ